MTLDDDLVQALRTDYRTADLSPADRAMLDYVAQLTRDAARLTAADLDRLRAVGFDDRGILQITTLASWFNYVNRVADALGLAKEDEERGGPAAPPDEL